MLFAYWGSNLLLRCSSKFLFCSFADASVDLSFNGNGNRKYDVYVYKIILKKNKLEKNKLIKLLEMQTEFVLLKFHFFKFFFIF